MVFLILVVCISVMLILVVVTHTTAPAPEESSAPVSATNGPTMYATVGKSKKKGPKETGDVVMFTHKEDQYAMPNKKEAKLTENGEAVVKSGGMEEKGQYI